MDMATEKFTMTIPSDFKRRLEDLAFEHGRSVSNMACFMIMDSMDRMNGVKKVAEAYSAAFEAIWSVYPKRDGANPKNKAYSAYKARIKEGCFSGDLLEGAVRYSSYCAAKGMAGSEFVMQAARFFGKERAFENDWRVNENDRGNSQVSRREPERLSTVGRNGEAARRYLAGE